MWIQFQQKYFGQSLLTLLKSFTLGKSRDSATIFYRYQVSDYYIYRARSARSVYQQYLDEQN